MTKNQGVEVSVIIPTYRRPDMLRTAIQSVMIQRNCTVEIIVVDDHSCDETENVVKAFPSVRYFVNSENRGPGYSRRLGLLKSRGDYIVFLDDDDYYTTDTFFETAVGLLEDNSEYVFVAANATVLDIETEKKSEEKLNIVGEITSADYLEGFPFRNRKPCSTFTTVFRKSAIVLTGVDKMKMANDMPIYMRCLTAGGKVYFLEESIGVYCIHGGNISKKITPEFIIANLEEKKEILLQVKENSLFPTHAFWWLKQIEGTMCYYVYGSNPSPIEYRKVKKWCINATEDKKKVQAMFKKFSSYLQHESICKVKQMIKQKLGLD